jgi:hypothetical protein
MVSGISTIDRVAADRAISNFRFLTLLALAAYHCGLLALVSLPDTPAFERARLVRDSLIIAQLALIFTWGVCGPGWWWLRYLVCPILAMGPAYLVAAVGREWRAVPKAVAVPVVAPDDVAFEGLWLRLAGLLIAGLLAWRMLGYRICFRDGDEPSPAIQFSLRSLLAVITLVAAAIAIGPKLRVEAGMPQVPGSFAYWSVATPLAVAVLSAVWAVMRPGGIMVRLPVLVVWIAGLGCVPSYLAHREEDLAAMAAWTVASCAIIAVSLLAVRSTGAVLIRATEQPRGTSAASA